MTSQMRLDVRLSPFVCFELLIEQLPRGVGRPQPGKFIKLGSGRTKAGPANEMRCFSPRKRSSFRFVR